MRTESETEQRIIRSITNIQEVLVRRRTREVNDLIAKYNKEKNWDKKGAQYQYRIDGKPHSISFQIANGLMILSPEL